MYKQWMTFIETEKLYKEISHEVRELSEHLESKTESETNKRLTIITIVGLPLAIAGLLFGFWQIYSKNIDRFTSIYDLIWATPLFSFELLIYALSAGIAISILFIIFIFKTEKGRKTIDWLTSLKRW